MILQLAVGPMCLMVFNTAKNVGLLVAMSLVLAIALVDAFYITLASVGVSKLLEKERVKKVFKLIGAIVLIIFGITTEQCSNTILYRLLFMIIIYTTIFFITKSIRIAKIKLNIYEKNYKNTKYYLFFSCWSYKSIAKIEALFIKTFWPFSKSKDLDIKKHYI